MDTTSSFVAEAYGPRIEQLQLALRNLYDGAARLPQIPEKAPTSQEEARVVVAECEAWVVRLASEYGVIPVPQDAMSAPDSFPEAPGVLGFFSPHFVIPPPVPPLVHLLGTLPPDLSRHAGGDVRQRGALLSQSGTWRRDLSSHGRMVLDGDLIADWEQTRNYLLDVLMFFRLLALRLIRCVNDRLGALEQTVLPRVEFRPGRKAEWNATVELAGVRTERVVHDAQAEFLRSLVERKPLFGTDATRRHRLVQELPEIGPFIATVSRKGKPRRKGSFPEYVLSAQMEGRITYRDAAP